MNIERITDLENDIKELKKHVKLAKLYDNPAAAKRYREFITAKEALIEVERNKPED